jgi:hypothetical protein
MQLVPLRLGLHAFDLKKTVEMDPEFLNTVWTGGLCRAGT